MRRRFRRVLRPWWSLRGRFIDWLDEHPLVQRPRHQDDWKKDLNALHSATAEGIRRNRDDREVYTPPQIAKPHLSLVDARGEPLKIED